MNHIKYIYFLYSMFFYIIHNSPFWEKLPFDKRIGRTYMVGIVCYVLLHTFLFSKFAETKENLKLFRNYMYYMLVGDIIVLNITEKMYTESKTITQSTSYLPNTSSISNLSNPSSILNPSNTSSILNPFNTSSIPNLSNPPFQTVHPDIFRSTMLRNNSSLQIPTYEEFLKMKQNDIASDNLNAIIPDQININQTQSTHIPDDSLDKTSIDFPLYHTKKESDGNNDIMSVNIPLYNSNNLNDVEIPLYVAHSK